MERAPGDHLSPFLLQRCTIPRRRGGPFSASASAIASSAFSASPLSSRAGPSSPSDPTATSRRTDAASGPPASPPALCCAKRRSGVLKQSDRRRAAHRRARLLDAVSPEFDDVDGVGARWSPLREAATLLRHRAGITFLRERRLLIASPRPAPSSHRATSSSVTGKATREKSWRGSTASSRRPSRR